MKLTVVAILAVLLAQSPLARADLADDYLGELQRGGVDISQPVELIKLGKGACSELQEGSDMVAVLNTIERDGFTGPNTGIIVRAAAHTFCPDQLSKVEGFIGT